jgi:hypothetical protein
MADQMMMWSVIMIFFHATIKLWSRPYSSDDSNHKHWWNLLIDFLFSIRIPIIALSTKVPIQGFAVWKKLSTTTESVPTQLQ